MNYYTLNNYLFLYEILEPTVEYEIDKKAYVDVTYEWILSATPNSHKVLDAKYFKDSNGIKYYVDGKNVVLDYSLKEYEVALWLEKTFGGKIYMNPRINNPKGIETCDYLWKNERWDLKTLSEKAMSETRAVDNAIKTAKNQTDNIVLDITETKLPKDNVIKQVHKLYDTKGRG